jgi:hypothetical protein
LESIWHGSSPERIHVSERVRSTEGGPDKRPAPRRIHGGRCAAIERGFCSMRAVKVIDAVRITIIDGSSPIGREFSEYRWPLLLSVGHCVRPSSRVSARAVETVFRSVWGDVARGVTRTTSEDAITNA